MYVAAAWRADQTGSTHKGVNQRSKYISQVQPELPTVTLTWHASKHKVHKFHQSYNLVIQMSLCTLCAGRPRPLPAADGARGGSRRASRLVLVPTGGNPMKEKQASSQQQCRSVSPTVKVGNIITPMGPLLAVVITAHTLGMTPNLPDGTPWYHTPCT